MKLKFQKLDERLRRVGWGGDEKSDDILGWKIKIVDIKYIHNVSFSLFLSPSLTFKTIVKSFRAIIGYCITQFLLLNCVCGRVRRKQTSSRLCNANMCKVKIVTSSHKTNEKIGTIMKKTTKQKLLQGKVTEFNIVLFV